MLNKVFIMGRLAADPELRHTQSGTAVASFRLACDRDFKDKSTGERATDWINVVAWRQTGEFVSRYFTKGRTAIVEGRLQTRSYEKDGQKRVATEVVADQVYFGDSKAAEGGASTGGYNQAPAAQSAYSAPYAAPKTTGDEFAELTDDDGELPF